VASGVLLVDFCASSADVIWRDCDIVSSLNVSAHVEQRAIDAMHYPSGMHVRLRALTAGILEISYKLIKHISK